MSYRELLILFFICSSTLLRAQDGPSGLFKSHQSYLQAKENTLFSPSWIPVGPVLNSARVEAVQADPNAPGTIYAAFGSGNLWKTTNNGLQWEPIFEGQPALGIGDIALAPSNPDILYLGSGESLRKNRNFTLPGNGVYRSDNGGKNWTHLGLADSWHIGEIAVHPTNPHIVFVAVLGKFWTPGQTRGLYRSVNGGKDWTRVLYVDQHTRANDVVIAPSDPNTVYTSMWENDISAPLSASVYGSNSGVYKSNDGGDSWTRISAGLPDGPGTGRIGLAVSHRDPNKVYALVDNRNEDNPAHAELYRSTDGGGSWHKTHQAPLKIFSVIGWYFADLYLNPQNDEEVYALGVRMAHSADGGKTFDLVGGHVEHINPSPAQTLHLDHCELWINPLNPNHLLLGNDGGLYQSYDSGAHWLHHNNIPTGEFYDIALDHRSPYRIYGGTQDDATVYGPAKERNAFQKDPWRYLWIDAWSGGDGCVTQVDPSDPNTVYFSMQNGYLLRKDLDADTSKVIAPARKDPFREKLQYQFVTPYIISPHDPQTLYHAGNYLLKSTDRGEQWQFISGDLSASAHHEKQSVAAGAVAESVRQRGLLYLGTDRGAFWTSRDGGQHWSEFSDGLANHYIRSICPSQHQTSRVYMAMTGLNHDDLGAYLYCSEDYGENWHSISANLPDEPVNSILEDPFHENLLYAGAYRGVYLSVDRGKSWHLLGRDLPAVPVGDLAIQEREKELVVGTHGRGIYFLPLSPIYEALDSGFSLTQTFLFRIPEAQYPKKRDTHRDIDQATTEKVAISFWLPQKEVVRLSVHSETDALIWEKELQGHMGFNQLRWDLVYEHQQSDEPYFFRYKKYLPPGSYRIRLRHSGGEQWQPLVVRKWVH